MSDYPTGPGSPVTSGAEYPTGAGAPVTSGATAASRAGATTAETSELTIGSAFSNVSKDLTTLMRQEIELAKAEMKQSATRAGKGAGMYAGAGVAGLLFLAFLSVALWWALGHAIGRGWSGLVVAVIWAIIAAILAAMGRAEMRKMNGMQATAETVKKIPPALKGQEPPHHTTARRSAMEER